MTDEKELMQQVDMIRESIRLDWANLTSKNLTPEQRKAIREDIHMCINALNDLWARLARLSKEPN